MKQYQQGDVVLHTVAIPETAKKKELKNGIVQHGEATGHAHKLTGNFEYFETPQKTRHLRLLEPVALTHEEHNKIIIPPGEYRIGIVTEYDHFDEEARQVVD